MSSELTTASALKGHFSALEENSDEPGVNEARGYACEFVAGQFLTNLKDSDIIESLLVELPPGAESRGQETAGRPLLHGNGAAQPGEQTPLLPTTNSGYFSHDTASASRFSSLTSQCENLSALEVITMYEPHVNCTLT